MLYPVTLTSGAKTKIIFKRNEPSRLTSGVTFFIQPNKVPYQKTMDGDPTWDVAKDLAIPFGFSQNHQHENSWIGEKLTLMFDKDTGKISYIVDDGPL
tara:strand:- start:192 stop:485 length:294 start_codon:yes stop_codon:yes gene_type:complete